MARVSTEVCTISGRRPWSRTSTPPATASRAPASESPTSTQPVNSPSAFQALSPCLSSTSVDMPERLSGSGCRSPGAGRPRPRDGGTEPQATGGHRTGTRGAAAWLPLAGTRDAASRSPCRRWMPVPRRVPRRIATISVHTSPLDQPGTGDAGGLNVYVVEVARQLARRGVEVEIFTRAVCRDTPSVVELAPGVLVRNMVAGPFEELDKNSLPGQICPFTFGVLRTEADFAPGRYDLVHAHYWLSGQVGAVAASRRRVP